MYIRKNRVYIRPKSYLDFKIVCRDFVQCDENKTQNKKANEPNKKTNEPNKKTHEPNKKANNPKEIAAAAEASVHQ